MNRFTGWLVANFYWPRDNTRLTDNLAVS
jgi:hypothetical protein